MKALLSKSEQALNHARGVIAQPKDASDAMILNACDAIRTLSHDNEERARALDLQALIKGEAA
ncbi:hypothetical protein [Planktotalea sp.]|uniref:hypothetical protein n=1 Tax=Planktotalea sp. TaxID=2029877 RepID=UPI003D6A299F